MAPQGAGRRAGVRSVVLTIVLAVLLAVRGGIAFGDAPEEPDRPKPSGAVSWRHSAGVADTGLFARGPDDRA